MGFRLTIHGIGESVEGLERAERLCEAAVREGLTDIGLDLLGKSVRDAPVLTGFLRGSGYARFNTGDIAHGVASAAGEGSIAVLGRAQRSAEPVVTVGFGAPYALRQHESLGYRHPRGGKAKYLEDNMKTDSDFYPRYIAQAIEDALRGVAVW